MKNWFLAFRPKTLTASLVPVLVGTSLAWRHQTLRGELGLGHFRLGFFALLSALCIQIGTNLVNDAMDFRKGTDTHERLGPARMTQSGSLNEKTVLIGAALFFLGAIAFGIPLVLAAGWPLLVVGLISIFCGYLYTAGPFPLAYHGWGDIFVVLFFGIVAVTGTFYVETGFLNADAVWAGLEVGALATVLIAINNLRDRGEDSKNNKKTLAVRLGPTFVRWEIALLCGFAIFAAPLLWHRKAPWAAALPLLVLPLAIKLSQNIFRNEPSRIYNKYLAQAAALHLLFGVLLSAGFLWL